MAVKKKVTLGIDIGGTNTAYGFVDQEGTIYHQGSIPTRADQPVEQFFERLFTLVRRQLQQASSELECVGIGVGAPNGNYYRGTIENPPNLGWQDVNVVEMVRKHLDLPTVLTNDANAAALGEMKFGAARGMKHFIEITLGTGLGSGVVVDGKVVYGHDGFAGEIGHVIVERNGRLCGCGRRGCLETYASATGIKRTVFELLGNSNKPSRLRNMTYEQLTAKDIYQAAKAGDPIAREAFEFTGRVLGEALANSVAYLSPEAIILFGGLTAAGDFIFRPTRKYLEENLLSVYRGTVRVIPSLLPEGGAAVLGAAALIWNELNSGRK